VIAIKVVQTIVANILAVKFFFPRSITSTVLLRVGLARWAEFDCNSLLALKTFSLERWFKSIHYKIVFSEFVLSRGASPLLAMFFLRGAH